MQKVKSQSAQQDHYRHIAPIYVWLEKIVFGRTLTRSRSFGLDAIPEGAKVLVVGGGTGEVLNYLPSCEIDYIESSESMIFYASRRVGGQMVHFHHITFSEYRSSVQYDHIVCQYFMDLFKEDELIEILKRVDHLSADHTILHIADFRKPQNGSGSWWQRWLVKLMYFFFRITTKLKTRELPEIEETLKHTGYAEVMERSWMKGLVFASVWSRRPTSSDL